MTLEQLKEKQDKITHGIYQGQMRSYTNQYLTDLSIEYAISVLGLVQQDLMNKFMTKSVEALEDKIQELKSLIS